MQLRAISVCSLAFAALAVLPACGDDDPASDTTDTADTTDTSDTSDTVDPDATDTDTDTSPDPSAVFAFRAAPGQSISEGPFPNDGLLDAGGLVSLAPLGADPHFGTIAKAPLLARTDAQIAKKKGFGFVSAAFFPMSEEPDLATFEGKVHYVALSGPEKDQVFPGQVAWFAPASALSVFPAWGHYLVPGATYGIVIDVGVKTKSGLVIAAPATFTQVIAQDVGDVTAEVGKARQAFAALRAFLATRDQAAVIGTVFTTEATMPFVKALFEAVDAFPRVTPLRHVRLAADGPMWDVAPDIRGADLDVFFGVPSAPFETMPTSWYGGSREDAKPFTSDGKAYTGGSFRGSIAYVVNGSLLAPSFGSIPNANGQVVAAPIAYEDGKPKPRTRAMVPFTVFFCQSHLKDGAPDPDKAIPFAIFTHGGTALRSDALGFAVANCAAGYATITADLPFHAGRQEVRYLPADDIIAPTRVDDENMYSGKKRGQEGFVPDGIGDNGPATTTVGGLFALPSDFDPEVLEANLMAVAVEAYTIVKYLEDDGPNGLGQMLGVEVDTSHLVMESLSFGTSFTTALMAGTDKFKGAVQSVGSGGMLTLNLPMAPNNAALAGGILRTILGLQSSIAEVNAGAFRDPMLAFEQWLSQRGDPAGYSPFVLRHREDMHALHVLGSGDSWDETLNSPAQLSFNAAWGLPVFTAGADWTLDASIPGASTISPTAYSAPVSGNLTFGARTQTAAFFYNAAACHAQVVTPICNSGYAPPYPPITPRATALVSISPICALHGPTIGFLNGLLAGQTPTISAPGAASTWLDACDDLYLP